MTLHYLEKTKEIGDKQKLEDDIDKLVKRSENGRCYSILGNVNVCTQGLFIYHKLHDTIVSEVGYAGSCRTRTGYNVLIIPFCYTSLSVTHQY